MLQGSPDREKACRVPSPVAPQYLPLGLVLAGWHRHLMPPLWAHRRACWRPPRAGLQPAALPPLRALPALFPSMLLMRVTVALPSPSKGAGLTPRDRSVGSPPGRTRGCALSTHRPQNPGPSRLSLTLTRLGPLHWPAPGQLVAGPSPQLPRGLCTPAVAPSSRRGVCKWGCTPPSRGGQGDAQGSLPVVQVLRVWKHRD